MLKRTEKYLEQREARAEVRGNTVNSHTETVSQYEYVTEGGFRLTPGTRFRVASEPGQIFDFRSFDTNKRGEQWISAYGGDRPKPEHKHRRAFRAFPIPGTSVLEPQKRDR